MDSEFTKKVNEIDGLLAEIREDQSKVEKGVKKAARRVRKNLSAISKVCKEARRIALEETQSESE